MELSLQMNLISIQQNQERCWFAAQTLFLTGGHATGRRVVQSLYVKHCRKFLGTQTNVDEKWMLVCLSQQSL